MRRMFRGNIQSVRSVGFNWAVAVVVIMGIPVGGKGAGQRLFACRYIS